MTRPVSRLSALLWPALFWVMATLVSAPNALAQGATGPGVLAPAPAEDGSVMFVMATVEGTRMELRQTRTAEGEDRFDARPVIEHLRGRITLEDTVISVLRFQDGARLSIDMADGSVTANGQTLGLIPGWTPRAQADTWLDANAISILTGTRVRTLEDGTLAFELDDRLRPQFDLELWVEGERVTPGDVEPRTIGPVLLLPLREIVEALGHTLEIEETTGFLTVIRVQDTANIVLDPNTGGVAVNGRFAGVSPNMSYAEPASLLFPASAVETLTGTHIKLKPGTNRVEITLDDRLGGGVLPDAYVLDAAKQTPFTVERLEYEFASEGQQALALHAHGGTLNGRGVVTLAGGLEDPAALRPSAMTIDLESLRGWRMSLGDINSPYRELSGTGTGRVRGASWQRQTEDGDIVAVTAGAPLSGSTRISETVSVPTFSGFAAGARLIRPDRQEEIGLSASSDGAASRIVASAQKQILSDRPRDKAGLKSAQASIDVGAFQGNAAGSVDLDAQASGTYRLSAQTQLRTHVAYRGASFLTRRSASEVEAEAEAEPEAGLAAEANADDEAYPDTSNGSRTNARVSLDWRAVEDWTILKDVGAATRVNVSRSAEQTSRSVGVSMGGRIAGGGPNVSVDVSQSMLETTEAGQVTAVAASLRLFKRFGWGDTQLVYQTTAQDGAPASARLVATATGQPVTRFLGKGAIVSLAPSASLVAANGETQGRFGASLGGDSGAALGDRLRIGGQLVAAQSLNPDETATEIFTNLSATYFVNRYIQFSASYGQSLNGDASAFLALRGSAPFNPPRKHTLPREGRGVLKGRAFLDRNRDGLRQADEPGIPGVVIGLARTRLRLGADRDGFFTIQNLKSGLYTLDVDRRTLPLGVMVSEDTILRATVGAGQITHVDVPIIASGQLRGAVFVDLDGSGAPNAGEPRLEGALVTLTALDGEEIPPQEQYAASFGQYAFESLAPGRYRLRAEQGGHVAEQTVELTEDELMVVRDLAAPAAPGLPPPAQVADEAPVQLTGAAA